LETLTLIENGEAAKAWLYVVLSVVLSMLGTALGAYLSHTLGV
jgi:fluoride ion exporter CrcB/FEX